MRYGSVCSGIEAATVAWHHLGWEPAFFSEIEDFPRAVLQHHHPETPLHGDFTTIGDNEYGSIDLLVGGTPCQSFSIAGLRGGMEDNRGNLALQFIKLANRKRARWVVWENVPGVFSSSNGEDFRCFLSGLAGWNVRQPSGGWQNSGIITQGPGGYGLCWRVLDAQYFGVAQRRRRVFVIGYFGDWRPAAAVLLEQESLHRNPPPRRASKQDIAGTIGGSSQTGGFRTTDLDNNGAFIPTQWPADVTCTLDTAFSDKLGLENQHINAGAPFFVPDTMGTITARMFNALGSRDVEEGAVIPVAFQSNGNTDDILAAGYDISPTVRGGGQGGNPPAIAFKPSHYTRGKDGAPSEVVPPLSADADKGDQDPVIFQPLTAVRRLTPTECERLQGFPDDYTLIPLHNKKPTDILRFSADGPRYKALGNSMAVPVMRWIGNRIAKLEEDFPWLNVSV